MRSATNEGGSLDACHDWTLDERTLAAAGLDYYNHNLDTSPEFYGEIITTPRVGDGRRALLGRLGVQLAEEPLLR